MQKRLTVDEMLGKPGIYEAANEHMHARGLCIHVEVDADGIAYQLTPDGVRDGVLPRDGWTPDAFAVPMRIQ